MSHKELPVYYKNTKKRAALSYDKKELTVLGNKLLIFSTLHVKELTLEKRIT